MTDEQYNYFSSTNEYEVYSNFSSGDKSAAVVKNRLNGSFGVVMQQGTKPKYLEYYPTHSEGFSEDVAENYVLSTSS